MTIQNRLLQRACKYVSDAWLPIDEDLYLKLQKRVLEGGCDRDLKEFLLELRSDVGAFTLLMTRILKLLKESGKPVLAASNPFSVIAESGTSVLKEAFSEPPPREGHSLNNASMLQTLRMHEILVGASVSEVIAPSLNADREAAYGAAILRQLGLALIAWNYPTVYEEALLSGNAEEALDKRLMARLGFSPSLLSVALLGDWGKAHQDLLNYDDSRCESRAAQKTLRNICEVGETLARANRPECYPSAKADWHKAKTEVQKLLGDDGMTKIHDCIEKNCSTLMTKVPHVFRIALIFDPEHRIENNSTSFVNPYLEGCDDKLKNKLLLLYELHINKKNREAALRLLAKEIIPLSEFRGGAVFTIDPQVGQLSPIFKLGDYFSAVVVETSYDISPDSQNLILEAFQEAHPIMRAKEGIIQCARSLGFSQRIGVFYLEVPASDFENVRTLTHFNALAMSILDCLRA